MTFLVPRSITGRLVSLYALSSFSILLLSGVFLTRRLDLHLARERDEFLADELSTLSSIQGEHPESLAEMREEIEFESDSRHFSHYYARILEGGRVLVETTEMTQLLPLQVFPTPLPLQPPDLIGTSYVARDGRTYLLAAATLPATHGMPERVLQVGMDPSPGDALLASYERDVGLAILIGTLLSTAAGWMTARRGLRPLREVAAHARRITVSQLHERVSSQRWPAELTGLSTAFDEMLERLQSSFERLSRFSADLAHELRTPINNLMGEAEVALTRSRSADDYREVIESSREEFGRLSRMIDSLLFLARAENVQTPLRRVWLDARAELDAVREFYEALAAEWEVRISVEGEGRLQADAALFRRVISNLLSNALNHTPKGGRVALTLAAAPDGLHVEVADTGCGVDAEHLPRLFERFYRVEHSQSRAQGTGLGLALVKFIVELHQGSVAIESTVGRGTTVRLRFPSAAQGGAKPPPLPEALTTE